MPFVSVSSENRFYLQVNTARECFIETYFGFGTLFQTYEYDLRRNMPIDKPSVYRNRLTLCCSETSLFVACFHNGSGSVCFLLNIQIQILVQKHKISDSNDDFGKNHIHSERSSRFPFLLYLSLQVQ